MYYPDKKEFLRLAKKGNLIPVYREILADLETPVSAFLKICDSDYSYLLESVEGEEKVARYSFLGSNPSLVFKSKGREIMIETRPTFGGYPEKSETRKFITQEDPLAEIKRIMGNFRFVHLEDLPRFCGGFVGYIGYDTVRFFEKIPDKNRDDLNISDCLFILTDKLIIFDHRNHKMKIVTNVFLDDFKDKRNAYRYAIETIENIYRRLKTPLKLKSQPKIKIKRSSARGGSAFGGKVTSNFTKDEFERIVIKAKEYIKKGDIIQVVLSQRFKLRLTSDPFTIYRNLRSLNPSPYMYYLKLNGIYLIGSSPEALVRCEDSSVLTRPIAGTRPRGKDGKEDRELESELLEDSKERAEHLMLVDLGRNDLGRVCNLGSANVKEFMKIERYSHVMHLVSEITATLRKDKDAFDVLRAVFPAGTVTGAPKIRAMEIIDELENIKRGFYAGCVGYFSFSDNLDTCITIRTLLIKDNFVYIQAGAGIVYDSKPQNEYLETKNKAKALFEALTL